jgi:hypothetical protein
MLTETDLEKLRKLTNLKPRMSRISTQFQAELLKGHGTVNLSEDMDDKPTEGKAQARLGGSPRRRRTKILKGLDQRLRELYAQEEAFTFKILRPWIILTEGDAVGAQHVLRACLKEVEKKHGPSAAVRVIDRSQGQAGARRAEGGASAGARQRGPVKYLAAVDSLGNRVLEGCRACDHGADEEAERRWAGAD